MNFEFIIPEVKKICFKKEYFKIFFLSSKFSIPETSFVYRTWFKIIKTILSKIMSF